MKPLIGITTTSEIRDNGKVFISLNNTYKEAVILGGGIPFLIPVNNPEYAKEIVQHLDGILFSGGEDVHPIFYGEAPLIKIGTVNPDRDRWELELFKEARKKMIPLLGICRGCQIINIALGGTLYQDIDSQIPGVNGHHPVGIKGDEIYHHINIDPTSELYKIFTTQKLGINSFHHQSVKKLGEGLVSSAFSEDGIIEAYQYSEIENNYIMGIQWHPEAMVNKHQEFKKIFENFIVKCKK
ncbi:MAG: gamma-glutamyl-gamma-aminobutyrate hydrolase family protein [Fusobacteriaceae bacterium]